MIYCANVKRNPGGGNLLSLLRPKSPFWILPCVGHGYGGRIPLILSVHAEHYLVKFKKFQTTATDGFALTWHWPALYFRLLVVAIPQALCLGTGGNRPVVDSSLSLARLVRFGGRGQLLVFSAGPTQNWEYRSRLNASLPAGTLSEIGGVNRWVWVLGLIVSLIFIAGFGLSAVMLHRFFDPRIFNRLSLR